MSLAKAACDASHCDNRQAYRYAKRTLDVLAAAPAVVLLAPLMLMIALAIRVDSPGAAIFRQERVGQYGRIFTLYKFRTMTSKDECPPGGNRLEYNRSRITRTGKFLRQTSLDELPQLFNVLRGDMSLVGPRPEIISVMLEKYEPWQYARLAVPPGITGWWQVTGRGTKPLHKHTQDDLYYIERASFWFDLKILLMTVRAVISRTGAY